MIIEKLAKKSSKFQRNMVFFQNARSGFKAYLESLQFQPDELLLLPAFIGWSPREGSGVFDPVEELSLSHSFYAIDESLHIDLASIENIFAENTVKLLVIIHYFGYVDPFYKEAVAIARRYGALVIEDEAHALYTDFIGGVSGRLGDAAIFSLHKMLPVDYGGLLCLNGPIDLGNVPYGITPAYSLTDFDLYSIAEKRINNAKALEKLIRKKGDKVILLRPKMIRGEIPQTFPIIVPYVSRDKLYDMMNSAGYGVVTLYHTLIDNISKRDYPLSHKLSRQILNLPVHQDIDFDSIRSMVDCLFNCISVLEESGDIHG